MRTGRAFGLVVVALAAGLMAGCSSFGEVGDTVSSGWNSLSNTVGGAVDSITPSGRSNDSDGDDGGRRVYDGNADGNRPSEPASDGHGAFRMP